MDGIWLILIFWGGWLLVPLLVDGTATVWHLMLALRRLETEHAPALAHDSDVALPLVSVIIPAYNEEQSIEHCLLSIQAQTYPHDRLEVIVVDDGSSDETANLVLQHFGPHASQQRYIKTNSFIVPIKSFGGNLSLVRRQRGPGSGKPNAFNAGFARASGELVVAVDADVTLAPDAIEQAVRAFLADPTLVAATGHLIIDANLVTARNEDGSPQLDVDGIPIPRRLSTTERLLTACQFLEYVTNLHLGRRAESTIDGILTVSGACAVFRAEAFKIEGQYRPRTVTEDADLTLVLHRLGDRRIGYLPTMRVHLSPILNWSRLYAQRFRWQRGAIEVSAIHLLRKQAPRRKWYLWRIVVPLHLQINHTLAFPRLMWTLVLFMLPLFGYSWALIAQVLANLYVLYLGISVARVLVAYLFSSVPEKVYIRRYLEYIVVYPIYKIFLFWVHLSADIRTLTEKSQWTVSTPLLSKLQTSRERSARRAP